MFSGNYALIKTELCIKYYIDTLNLFKTPVDKQHHRLTGENPELRFHREPPAFTDPDQQVAAVQRGSLILFLWRLIVPQRYRPHDCVPLYRINESIRFAGSDNAVFIQALPGRSGQVGS